MENPLIIKGGIYFDGETVLKAHYSGYFFMVDCTEYKTKEVIKQEYDKETAKDFLSGSYITNEGVKYYECQYSPYGTKDLELLSDVSYLELEMQYEFD